MRGVPRVVEWQNMKRKGQRRGETLDSKISVTKEIKLEMVRTNYVQRIEHRIIVELHI